MTESTVNRAYLRTMTTEELVEALTHRRRMAATYRTDSRKDLAWAAHHDAVAEEIEAEIERRGT